VAADPLAVLRACWNTIFTYAAGDDLERLAAVAASWQLGDWVSLPGAMISLAPTLLKTLGLLGLASLCWLERFETGLERARLPAILLGLLLVSGALGIVDERSLLVPVTLLIVFAFASLSALLPGAIAGISAIGLLALMLFNQLGAGYAPRLSPAYRASDQVAEKLRDASAAPNRVMSASWSFYDTRSPWKERYRPIPAFVDSVPALQLEMRRQGASFLVFDRQTGADEWPRLAELLDTDRSRPGFVALGPRLRTDQSPANEIAIYRLE
jgi:hypothetical protein